jgi:hypothetical protein
MNQTEILTAPIADAIILRGIVDRPSACGAFIFCTMKEIKLSQCGKDKGKYVALVDDEDFEYLNQFKWNYHRINGSDYAQRCGLASLNEKRGIVLMHRFILKTPKGMDTDHIDHNGLNNQKSNLRACTHRENLLNGRTHSRTGYKGVYFSGKYIIAQIIINGKVTAIGSFKTIEDAAKAYNTAALKHYKEYANLNIIPIINN